MSDISSELIWGAFRRKVSSVLVCSMRWSLVVMMAPLPCFLDLSGFAVD